MTVSQLLVILCYVSFLCSILCIEELNYICGHILPTIRFYHKDILLYFILSIQ
jgi:hypothetical protein